MIYSDHEVRDNWGGLNPNWNKESQDFFVAHCAWLVNLEYYQCWLYEDINFSNFEEIERCFYYY
jgi:hypothetical protein